MDSLYEDRGNYCWPDGFWVDANFHEDSFDSFTKGSAKYNITEKVGKLGLLVEKQFGFDKTNDIFLTFGCDYAFT